MNNFCYIHIPFCISKCKYCRFASFGILDKLKVKLYVDNLIKEIQKNKIQNELGEYSKTDFNKLKSVYFGGGTPSILDINDLKLILDTLEKKFGFDENIEINIEATPNTITEDNIRNWKKIGINRLSIGIQTLNNKSLIEIGRGNKGDILNALEIINSVGFNNVSVDFIIGLPYVQKCEINRNIDFLLTKYDFIKHVSVYMLEEYYEIPNEIDSKFENIVYPNNWNKLGLGEDEFLDEYISIKNKLKEYGFNNYEISNFSKTGFECKHNKAYWNHSNILAFGLGSHGFFNNKRYSNSEDFLEYYSAKNIVINELSEEDFYIEELMFELRTDGISKNNIGKLNKEKIDYFIENKYLQKKSDKLILSDKGILVLDYILSEII